MTSDLGQINNKSNENGNLTMLPPRQIVDLGSNAMGSPGEVLVLTANNQEKRFDLLKGTWEMIQEKIGCHESQ